jgi:alpha-1,6-mannosyltransferase
MVKPHLVNAIIVIVYMIGLTLLNFITTQQTFHWILIGYTMAFASYAMMVHRLHENESRILNISTVGATILCMASFPALSDDVYRFMWDGELLFNGVNPYAYLPSSIIEIHLNPVFGRWYPELNSPAYYSVYPFTCQAIFLLGTVLGKLGISPVFGMKLIYTIIHLVGFVYASKIASRYHIDKSRLYWYYLNPLVLVEGIGNVHAEVVMVALTLAAIHFLLDQRWLWAALLYSLAIATKLTVLMLLPFMFYYLWSSKQYKFIFYTMVITAMLFLPLVLDKGITGFASSLDLYFRKFEFNASLYYILRYVGRVITGYNQIAIIGPLLSLMTIYVIAKFSFDRSHWPMNVQSLSSIAVTILTTHLLCSTTVHPWYLITILIFSVFMGYKCIVLWSYCITWTYINYAYSPYHENLWMVAMEYSLIALFAYYFREIPFKKIQII